MTKKTRAMKYVLIGLAALALTWAVTAFLAWDLWWFTERGAEAGANRALALFFVWAPLTACGCVAYHLRDDK